MLREIIEEIELAIDSAYAKMYEKDYLSFVLLIGRADVVYGLRNTNYTDCVIDYQSDRYYDETREGFYIRYMNRNYRREGFCYEGDEGIDDLNIEMMIYDHLWDSSYFLKSLVRMASILSGKGYLWDPQIPLNGKWTFIQNDIIVPLKESDFSIGDIIEKAYSSHIRNAFAHSLYNINKDNRTITIRPKTGVETFSFIDFQKKFLYSVVLMNKMQKALEQNHLDACRKKGYLTEPFMTPDGVKVRIYAETIIRDGFSRPIIRMVLD